MKTFILKTIGYFLIPLFMLITSLYFKLFIDNYTSILSIWYIKLIACLIIIFFYYLLKDLNNKYSKAFLILTLLVIIIPYNLNQSFFSFWHVLLAYIALFIFNWLLYTNLSINTKKIYLFTIGICIAIIFRYGSITGLTEIIYISTSSILLTNIKASKI